MKVGNMRTVRYFAVFLFGALILSGSAWPAGETQITTQTAPASDQVTLREGTEVRLKLNERLSSKTAVEGEPVNLVLDQDLKVGDVVVARAGTVAVGTISHASKSGMLGRPGDLGMSLEYLRAGNATVLLRGTKGRQGNGKEGTAVALTILFGPIGLIKHGKNAEFKEGTLLTAYAEQDTELRPVD